MPNYSEKIDEFDGVIALCDQELENLRKTKRNQSPESRKKQVEDKFSQILQNPVFARGDDIIETWEKLKKEGSELLSISTDLSPAHSPAKSQEWYKSSDIFRILDRKVSEIEDVAFSNMILVGKYDNFDPKKVFTDQFEEAKEAAKKGKSTIMPINLRNKHWVGGMMRKTSSGKIQFVYNDSLGASIDDELLDWISDFDSSIEVVNLGVMQQVDTDRHNCGPYMVDNLLKLANNNDKSIEDLKNALSPAQTNPEKLREEHAQILREEIGDRDEAEKICQALKERAICGKMLSLFEQFKEENRMVGNKIQCSDTSSARALAEQIKRSYEDLGVSPCELRQDGENWVVRLPQECRGKDPFAMNSEELSELKSRLRPPSVAPAKTSAVSVQHEEQKSAVWAV